MLTAVNKYMKKQINKLNREDKKELIDFATFLQRQKKKGENK